MTSALVGDIVVIVTGGGVTILLLPVGDFEGMNVAEYEFKASEQNKFVYASCSAVISSVGYTITCSLSPAQQSKSTVPAG